MALPLPRCHPRRRHRGKRGGDPGELIPLTVPEVRRLLGLLLLATDQARHHRLRWSGWRRKRQAAARRSHYRRRMSVIHDEVLL